MPSLFSPYPLFWSRSARRNTGEGPRGPGEIADGAEQPLLVHLQQRGELSPPSQHTVCCSAAGELRPVAEPHLNPGVGPFCLLRRIKLVSCVVAIDRRVGMGGFVDQRIFIALRAGTPCASLPLLLGRGYLRSLVAVRVAPRGTPPSVFLMIFFHAEGGALHRRRCGLFSTRPPTAPVALSPEYLAALLSFPLHPHRCRGRPVMTTNKKKRRTSRPPSGGLPLPTTTFSSASSRWRRR